MYGPRPDPDFGTISSFLAAASAPNPMPTVVVALKPVPETVTEAPGVADVGDRVMVPAALTIGRGAKTTENTRKANKIAT